MANNALLIEVLLDARELVARPGNDFSWSSWEDADSALKEIDGMVAKLRQTQPPPLPQMQVIFAPTGPMQEVSLSSGWGDEFLHLASRFDAALNGE